MGNTSILDGIRVASPCPANWDAMAGDDRSRSCEQCGLRVYNLSMMTTPEATALVAAAEGRTCVRFYRRADGTVLTRDCPVGARSLRDGRLRKIAGLGLVGLAMTSTAVAALGFGRFATDPPPSGDYSTRLDDWIDWGLVKIGWRKPAPSVVVGEMSMPIPPSVPASSFESGEEDDPECREKDDCPARVVEPEAPSAPRG